jgi:hypothetical protein
MFHNIASLEWRNGLQNATVQVDLYLPSSCPRLPHSAFDPAIGRLTKRPGAASLATKII